MGRILLFILLLLWPAFSFAQDEKDAFFALKFIRKDAATSSSKCIGKPVTPECAMDTWEACGYWWDNDLCRTVQDKDLIDKHSTNKGGYHDLGMLAYKPLYKGIITDEDIDFASSTKLIFGDSKKWQSGDIVILNTAWSCEPDSACYSKQKSADYKTVSPICPPVNCSIGSSDTEPLYMEGFIIRNIAPDTWHVIDHFTPADRFYERFMGIKTIK